MVESRAVKLSRLFAEVEERSFLGTPDVDISSLAYRSTEVKPGGLFFCVPGFVRDGHDYGADAVQRGAAALCVERWLDVPVPQVVVPSVRGVMGRVAATFYDDPSCRLATVGITGTNGKTTTAFLVAHLLDSARLPAGLLGTVERRIGGKTLPAGRTTPEAIDIQRDLAAMVEEGDKAAVMEVSSHALELDRVHGVRFRCIAFTNLTQDHLDFHKDLESYFRAKSRLFVDPEFSTPHTVAVINVDDPHGRELAARYPRSRTITFSTATDCGEHGAADLRLVQYSMTTKGSTGVLCLQGRAAERAGRAGESWQTELFTPLVGVFNLSNCLAAVGIGLALGLDPEGMIESLRSFKGVPGRMERVDAGQDFLVLVDYAHTPDSVGNVLRAARGFTRRRLIVVLGCGGDRDRKKRPLMGREAELGADVVVITSDNPRSENPLAIIQDILAGLERPDLAVVEPDRRAAIGKAIAQAKEGDTVLILGKGHETGQEFADRTVPFDDREVARHLLAEMIGQAS